MVGECRCTAGRCTACRRENAQEIAPGRYVLRGRLVQHQALGAGEDEVGKDASGDIVVCAVAGDVSDGIGGLDGRDDLRNGGGEEGVDDGRSVGGAKLEDAALLCVGAGEDGHPGKVAELTLQRGSVDERDIVDGGVECQGLLVNDLLHDRGIGGADAGEIRSAGRAAAVEGRGEGEPGRGGSRRVDAAV